MLIGTAFIAAAIASSAQAEDTSLRDARLEFGEVGADVPLCAALIEAARKRLSEGLNQCSPPIPADDARFGQVKWQALEPADHMEIMKQMFVWNVVSGNWIPNSQSISRELEKGPPINPTLMQDVWDRYGHNYPDLINAGKVQLQGATVDLAPDASSISVYRTNLVSAANQSGNSDWSIEGCSGGEGKAANPRWRLFYEYRSGRWEEFVNLNNWVFPPSDLVLWAGRAYQIDLRRPAGFVVLKHGSRGGSVFTGRDLCVVKTVWK
jgi:hypothetical protein